MIEIDNESASRAVDVADAGLPRDVFKPATLIIVEEVATMVSPNGKDVEPTVVVVIHKRHEHRAGGKRERHPAAHIGEEAALHRVQRDMRLMVRAEPAHQQILAALLVVVPPRERRPGAAEVGESTLARDVGEPDLAGIRSRRDAAHRDERLRIE